MQSTYSAILQLCNLILFPTIKDPSNLLISKPQICKQELEALQLLLPEMVQENA
jgi:hypothetical protein